MGPNPNRAAVNTRSFDICFGEEAFSSVTWLIAQLIGLSLAFGRRSLGPERADRWSWSEGLGWTRLYHLLSCPLLVPVATADGWRHRVYLLKDVGHRTQYHSGALMTGGHPYHRIYELEY